VPEGYVRRPTYGLEKARMAPKARENNNLFKTA